MNYDIGNLTNINSQISSPPQSSSSSSSSEEFEQEIRRLELQQMIILQTMQANNAEIARILEQENNQRSRGGSVRGHRVINHDREGEHLNLVCDCFSQNPLYGDVEFRRRFCMSRSLFLRIVTAVKDHDNYFEQRRDGLGKLGLSTLQKATVVFRMLAFGIPGDLTDEYIKIGESTAMECLKRFCRSVIEVFSTQYLRFPNENDIVRLLYVNEQRGFPGMLGSLDCMHWKWNKCPTAWAGQYTGRSGSLTIILEAIADYDLWIWHAYFGMPGSNNDINVLESYPLFYNMAQGIAPPAHYVINGKEYHMGYYLADDIYQKWSTIVQTIRNPYQENHKYFAERHETCRKDVERAFAVLQSKFAIVANPARIWDKKVLHVLMIACIIMHNMIVEDERYLNAPIRYANEAPTPDVQMIPNRNSRFDQFLTRYRQVKDKNTHFELRNALIDHLWARRAFLSN